MCVFLDNDLTLEKPTEQDSEVAFVLIPKVWWKPNVERSWKKNTVKVITVGSVIHDDEMKIIFRRLTLRS